MRKRMGLCILGLCLLLAACEEPFRINNDFEAPIGETNYMEEYDAQNKYFMATLSSFQETNSFFCGSSCMGSYLQYYDKASGITGMLCADPACSHNSADCSAYIQSGATLSYYDGNFYWIATDPKGGNDFYLWQSDLSGTNRKQIKRLSLENVIMAYQPQRYVVHRGELYMLGKSSSVTGTQVGYRISILSTSLDDSEDITVLYDNTIDRGVNMTTRFVGNAIYLSLVTFPEGGPFDITILKFDTKSGNSETVYEESGMATAPGAIWVTEQGEIYLPGADTDRAYVWKIEDGVRTEIISWEGANLPTPQIMDGIVANIYMVDGIRHIRIASLDGVMVYEGALFPDAITGLAGDPNKYTYAVIGGDAEKIIVNLQNFTGTGLVDYTIMLDVTNNMKPTLLWSSQR